MEAVRKIFAIILGILAGGAAILGMETLGHQIYPPPPGLNPENADDVAAYLEQAPLGALLFIPLAWAVGSFVAGMVATLVCNDRRSAYALTCGMFLLVGGIAMLLMVSHPVWLWIVSAFVFIPSAWLGFKLVGKKK